MKINQPAMQVPVNSFLITEEDKLSVLDALNQGWISSEGPYIKEFENNLSEYFGVNHAVVVSSGSAALDVAVRALELKKNFVALLPDHTIISCANSIVYNDGKILLADSNLETWNQDLDLTINYIEKYKPDLVLVSHTYGLPFKISKIKDLCKSYNIPILEDAAEMIGQLEDNKLCGSLSDIATFSFYPNKHITTGEGGAILTNNSTLADKARYYRNLCFNTTRRFKHDNFGWNYRMSSMQAALGSSQLKRLKENITRKREIGERYNNLLKRKLDMHFKFPLAHNDNDVNIYWVYGLVSQAKDKTNSYYQERLKDYGIGTRPFFFQLSQQPCLSKYIINKDDIFPNSALLSQFGFYIPSGINLSNAEIDYVSSSLLKICQ